MPALLASSIFLLQTAAAKPMTLDELSYRAFKYFVEQSHPVTGFTKDRARNWGSDERENKVASIAAMGFTLPAYAIGVHRGWMKRPVALAKSRNMLRQLLRIGPREHGWFYHFFEWNTGKRVWNCEVSSIDTGIFVQGMLLAERAFNDKDFTALSNRILKDVDWKWMVTRDGKRPESPFVCHGWKPETGFLDSDWGSYCELHLLYVQAHGMYPQMPKAAWEKIRRPEYEYNGIKFLAGGPLFMHQMSHVFIDFKSKRDTLGYDYWVASRNAMHANRAYCIDNPKGFKGYSEEIWGLSASDSPKGYEAHGAPGDTYDNGTLAPSSAVAAAMFDRKLAENAARDFSTVHPETVGQYGFTISFNPTEKWMSPHVIGIDLGQMLLSIENSRDGFPNKMSMRHPINQIGLKKMGFVTTKEGPVEKRALRISR